LASPAPLPWPSLLLVGPTGSGKTPLGQELERRGFCGRRCVHFDFGAILREVASGSGSRKDVGADELAAIRRSLASGALFEDRDMPMIIGIVERFARFRNLTHDALLILNGLPRHRRQAEGLTGTVDVERVVLLEAAAAIIRERIRLDPAGDRAGRTDDTLEAVERRLSHFRERTLPLLDLYRERGVPVSIIRVTAVMSAELMADALLDPAAC
jgi:adenylate kinase